MFELTTMEVHMNLERIVHRIASDAPFAAALSNDPSATLEPEGLKMSPRALKTLEAALRTGDSFDQLADVSTGPTEWFASQFAAASSGLTGWFASQFHSKGA